MNEGDLRSIMAAYQDGSMEAFERLYAALVPSLLSYLASLSGSRVQAEDLLQEAFLQIHRSRHAYRADLPVRPWVFTIARHVWLMHRRTRSRRPNADADLPDLPVTPDVERLGDREAIRRALARVAPDRREALLLHHVWGFSFAEIGRMLGVTSAAAKLRSSRGMNDLRTAIREVRMPVTREPADTRPAAERR